MPCEAAITCACRLQKTALTGPPSHSFRLFSLYHNTRYLKPQSLLKSSPVLSSLTPALSDNDGTLVKAILPCTPLAIVKALEHCHVYNTLLPYGSRAYGKTITVVNR